MERISSLPIPTIFTSKPLPDEYGDGGDHSKIILLIWSGMSMHVIQSISGPLFSYEKSTSRSVEQDISAYLIEPMI